MLSRITQPLALWVVTASLLAHVKHTAAASSYETSNSASCRYLPGDKGWPSAAEWRKLNSTVAGRLIATVPGAYVCHDPTYDAEKCAALQQSWTLPQTHFVDPSGFMASYQQNASCDPFTPQSSPCLQGNYVEYAINVTDSDDVIAGVKFAQKRNVRLVIKNTGHDYLGKSTGKGALSLWTHNLKSIEFLNYTSDAYTGPAVKMGAGVQAYEAYQAADKVGLQVVGGQCITVGIAGGYTQGGGHSLLTSKHGMGADQALEWEVVTANGNLVTASPTENSDLYWALSGGGGGTYGVVLSLTAKAYPDGIVGGVSLIFARASSDDEVLWNAVEHFLNVLPSIVDAGAHVQWAVFGSAFVLTEATIPGFTEADMREVFAPFTDYLTGQDIQYQMNVTSYPTFLEHADRYLGPLPYGTIPAAQIQGGVMISRSTVAESEKDIISVLRNITTSTNFIVASYSFNASNAPSSPNAVLPAWRDALVYFVVFQFWNYTVPFGQMDAQERLLTEEVMPPLQKYASGAYLNEADFRNPKWREEFYGENWQKLTEVKEKWDKKGLFYATTAIGSDAWRVEDDGRLCRAH